MSVDNNIPNAWVETTLGEVCEKMYSGGTPSTKRDDYYGGKIPWIRTQEVKFNFIREVKIKITEKGFSNSSAKWIPENTVIIAMYGNSAGKVALSKVEATTNQACCNFVSDKNKSNPFFIFYNLLSRYKEIEGKANGAAQQNLSVGVLKNLNINLPPIKEQTAIAQILTAFDDKIENLQAQNKTLETTAQTIFKEWFGKYQIGDELPDGWRMFQMNELVEIINGYSYKGKDLVEESDEALVSLKSFDRNGGFQTRGFKPFKGNPKGIQEVQIGDLIVAHTDLTQDAEVLGNPAFIFDNGGFKKMYITMDLVKVISIHKDISSSFLYYLMKDRAFKGHCVGYSNGTTVLHLSKKAIPEYQVFLPIDLIKVKEFSEIANATTNKISLNKDELKYLKQTRDTLLPKLMSGQLRIKDFKETAV
jgi:type I restriction enzyme S subunit